MSKINNRPIRNGAYRNKESSDAQYKKEVEGIERRQKELIERLNLFNIKGKNKVPCAKKHFYPNAISICRSVPARQGEKPNVLVRNQQQTFSIFEHKINGFHKEPSKPIALLKPFTKDQQQQIKMKKDFKANPLKPQPNRPITRPMRNHKR